MTLVRGRLALLGRLRWVLLAVAALLVGVLVGALSVMRERAHQSRQQAAAGQQMSLPVTVEGQAKLRAQNVVNIAAPIEGTLRLEPVEVGAEVHSGQLLAVIENSELTAEVQKLQEDLRRAEARVQDLEAQLASARLEASRAEAQLLQAQSEYEEVRKEAQRQRRLYQEGATPRLVYEEAQRKLEVEQKQYDAVRQAAQFAQERVRVVQQRLDLARKARQEAQAALEEALQDSAAAEVHSPVDGILVAIARGSGEEVSPAMEWLFQIAVDLRRMEAVLELPPDQVSLVRPGMPAVVRVAEVSDSPFNGSVKRVNGSEVVVEFINPSPAVLPGATAFVTIRLR